MAFNRLLEEISKIKHNFFVSVEIETWPPQNVSYKDLKSKLISWLNSFEPNIEERGHTFTYNLSGCNIKFELIPKKDPTKDSIYGMYMGPGYSGPGTSTQIRNQIQSKIRKYKEVKDKKIPLVIAVCSSGAWGTDEYNLETELFGRLQIIFSLNDIKKTSQTKRDFYGLFTPKPALRGVRNTRLSAVLFCKRIWNEGRAVYNMRVFHNPWASCPLDQSIFSKLPQFIKIKEENNMITCDWVNDNKQVIVFS